MAPDYQNLVPDYPRFSLATFPSPLHRVERFEAALRAAGCRRSRGSTSSATTCSSLGLGGNKIRNLEFLIGQALAEGATDVITEGGQQSNHCRLTAAACAKAGLRAHLVLTGAPPAKFTGNLLLAEHPRRADVLHRQRRARARRRGSRISRRCAGFAGPLSSPSAAPTRGARSDMSCSRRKSRADRGLGERRRLVLATATGGTQAGLLAGLAEARATAAGDRVRRAERRTSCA